MATNSAKKVLNNPDDVVYEMLDGFVQTNPGVVRLDGFPDIKVIRRKTLDGSKVAVVAGGGSGHEPSFAGYVGEGMLSAAVCGDVFASPSVDAVLAAIRTTGPAGCLLIIMNYTGDRLNFGLAAERAKQEGFKVKMVVVGEDCAIAPSGGVTGRRGLAGTLLVHKVAGAAAEAGLSLDEVYEEAKRAAESVGTMGVALTVCTLPGQPTSDRLGPDQMELGLGIHGEPGAEKGPIRPCNEIVDAILSTITTKHDYLPVSKGEEVALMVNSLGALPPMELAVISKAALAWLAQREVTVRRVFVGTFMTSLDMNGFSLTLMRVDGATMARLDASHQAPAWPLLPGVYEPAKAPVPVPAGAGDAAKESSAGPASRAGVAAAAAITAACNALIGMEAQLTQWDTLVGDGDCGLTLTRGAKAIIADMDPKYPLDDPSATSVQLGLSVRRSMGGTSGALYDIFFNAAAASLKTTQEGGECGAGAWAEAFAAGTAAIQHYGGASAGHRTMLDALLPAAAKLQQALADGTAPADAMAQAAAAAQAGAESTKHMGTAAGRSSYVPEAALKDTPDPGAMAAACWLQAVAQSLK